MVPRITVHGVCRGVHDASDVVSTPIKLRGIAEPFRFHRGHVVPVVFLYDAHESTPFAKPTQRHTRTYLEHQQPFTHDPIFGAR